MLEEAYIVMIYAPYDYIYKWKIYIVYRVDFVIVNKIFGQLFFCIAVQEDAIMLSLDSTRNANASSY